LLVEEALVETASEATESVADDLGLRCRRTLRIRPSAVRYNRQMSERAALLAKCEELLAFLAAHDEHLKLRRLRADIEELRERLLSSDPPPAREMPDDAAL
jgi:hypothetical protein